MTAAISYQIKEEPYIKAICKIINSIYKKGNAINIVSNDEGFLSQLDAALWTFEQLTFIPHLSAHEEKASKTPVILSNSLKSPNNSNIVVCFSSDIASNADITGYERVVYCASEHDEKQLLDLRIFVEKMKELNINTNSYVQQTNGSWAAA